MGAATGENARFCLGAPAKRAWFPIGPVFWLDLAHPQKGMKRKLELPGHRASDLSDQQGNSVRLAGCSWVSVWLPESVVSEYQENFMCYGWFLQGRAPAPTGKTLFLVASTMKICFIFSTWPNLHGLGTREMRNKAFIGPHLPAFFQHGDSGLRACCAQSVCQGLGWYQCAWSA